MKKTTRGARSVVLGLAIFSALCVTALAQQPFSASYVNTFSGKDGDHNIWTGEGKGNVVGYSSNVIAVKVMGNKGEGVDTITASNGDTLVVAFAQTPVDKDKLVWSGTFSVTGGTGRFDNATGGGTAVVSLNADGTAAFTLTGWIRL